MHGTEMEVILLGTIEPTSNLHLTTASEDVINLSISVSPEPESGLPSSTFDSVFSAKLCVLMYLFVAVTPSWTYTEAQEGYRHVQRGC